MSVKQMGLVWELNLPPNQKIVLLALADHADDDGGNVYPSIKRTAWKTGYNERQVQRILSELRESGLIEQVANAEGGRGKTTRYQLYLEKGDKLSPFTPDSQSKGDKSSAQRVTSETVKGDAHVTRTIIEPPVEPSEEYSVSHETALIEKLPTPFEVLDLGCQVLGIEARSYGPDLSKQLAVVKRMLAAGHAPADITGCLGWLWSNEFRRRNGVDFFDVEKSMARYVSSTAPPPPPQISDIKNPFIRSLMNMREEDFDGDAQYLPAQNGRPRIHTAPPRRIGSGSGSAQPDVLHPPARSQP